MSRPLSFVLWILLGFFLLFIFFALFGGCTGSGAKLQRVKADFISISSALKSYRKTTGDYPTTDQGLMALVTRPETLPAECAWQPIATKVPTDPWKNEYRYRRRPDSSPRSFELRCVGPDGVAGNEDDRVSE
jgi:general secretion pathway protein G